MEEHILQKPEQRWAAAGGAYDVCLISDRANTFWTGKHLEWIHLLDGDNKALLHTPT